MKSQLNYKVIGTGSPIIILHGLFGLLDNWLTIGKRFSEKNQVWLIDQRNHGLSPHFESHTYEDLCSDLDDFISFHQIKQPILIGHSMGGKAVMTYALKYPDKIKGIIVADIAPRAYSLHHLDLIEAINSIKIEKISSRKQAEDQIQQVIPDIKVQHFILKNLSRESNGFKWKINIPALTANIESIGGALAGGIPYHGPVLFLKGEFSDYIQSSDIQEINELYPNAIIKTIPQSSHWIHADNPEVFFEFCNFFIQENE